MGTMTTATIRRNRKQMQQQRRSMRRQPLALALAVAFALPAAPVLAQSLPTGETVMAGDASIGVNSTTMTITQNQNSIINWNTFDIATGYTVDFQQQAGGVTLNRVIGTDASSIDGSLTATGSVFLINPAGITFGGGAQVNVGGLVASAMSITDEAFLSGLASNPYLFSGSASGGVVQNLGSINVRGDAVFIGYGVENNGVVNSDGDIWLGGGSGAGVRFDNSAGGADASDWVMPGGSGSFVRNTGTLSALDTLAIEARNVNLSGQLSGGAQLLISTHDSLTISEDIAIANFGSFMLSSTADEVGIIHSGVLGPSPVFITDGVLNKALNSGIGVTVTASRGNLVIHDGVVLNGGVPGRFLWLDAWQSIIGGGFSISPDAGPMDITLVARQGGIALNNASISSNGGDVIVMGTATGANEYGVTLVGVTLDSGAGDTSVTGTSTAGTGVSFGAGSITTTTGDISIISTGLAGLNAGAAQLATETGSIHLEGHAQEGIGVFVGGGLTTNGGDIEIIGDTDSDVSLGVLVYGGDIQTNGGAITISGDGGSYGGVAVTVSNLESGGGDISIEGNFGVSSPGARGVSLNQSAIHSSGGNLSITGFGVGEGRGVYVSNSEITTSGGDIQIEGDSAEGVTIHSSQLFSGGGNITLSGTGQAFNGVWLNSGEGSTLISSEGGDIAISGTSNEGAGIGFWGMYADEEVVVDAGNGLVKLRSSNDGTGRRAIEMVGYVGIASDTAVMLTPYDTDDTITLGDGSGFSLTSDELSRITSPVLGIGGEDHSGAIRVVDAVSRDGNLTLSNGAGGISIEAMLDIGDNILGLNTGSDIVQTTAGAIIAGSLLIGAGGDALLDTAQNHVGTLASGVQGNLAFQNVGSLTIGPVSAWGTDVRADPNGILVLHGVSSGGVGVGGNALVRTLSGNLALAAGSFVYSSGAVDLVTAGTFQGSADADLIAGSAGWRIWASTWEGENRGELTSGEAIPNLYGCTWQGLCAATASMDGNHFIYQQQPVAVIVFDDAVREYGQENPAFTFGVTGAIFGDSLAIVATGSAATSATSGSDPGKYAISGSGWLSPAGYRLQFTPGTLTILPPPASCEELGTCGDRDAKVGADPSFAIGGFCPEVSGNAAVADDDALMSDWFRVRKGMGLTNCIYNNDMDGCAF